MTSLQTKIWPSKVCLKFISIMRKTFLVVLFVVIGISSFAQNASSNPFSYYGLGEISSNNHAIFSGIGNTQITMIDSSTLNFYNPASYNALGKGQPLFTTGISSRLSFYNQNDTREFNPATGIQSFAMGFSFAKETIWSNVLMIFECINYLLFFWR